jgi:hypothetical protein
MTKKKEETLTKTDEKTEEPKETETEQVTPVTEVTPEAEPSPAPEAPAKKQLEPVVISDLPTKKPVAPVNFAANDQKVLEWYNSRSGGEKYTRQEAADQLEISVDEFNNSISNLQKKVIGENLGHIVDE